MKLSRVPVLAALSAATIMACGGVGDVGTAAKAGTQSLPVDRLASIMAGSQAPLELEVARSIAELWVNYQLAGVAAAKNDTITDNATIDDGLWSAIQNMRVRQLYDSVKNTWSLTPTKSDQERYDAGEFMSARHILVSVAPDAKAEDIEAARRKAEQLRGEATPANFVRLAARSDEPGAAERGGDLGVFTKGTMVPEFETAVLALKPGEISPVVRTQFGFHVIYRKPFGDVANDVAQQSQQRNLAVAESTYLADMEKAAKVTLPENVAATAKEIARSPLAFRDDRQVVATYTGGTLTAARLADWIAAYPPQTQIRPQLANAPDTLAEAFIKQIVRNELLLMKADSAKLAVNQDELANLRLAFRNNLTMAWTTLGVEPKTLADSAGASGDREAVAGRIVEQYFDKLVKNEIQFADVAYPVARALQSKYAFTLNEPGLERALEKARQLRAAADSTGGAAGAAPPGAAAPGAPPGAAPGAPPASDPAATGTTPPTP